MDDQNIADEATAIIKAEDVKVYRTRALLFELMPQYEKIEVNLNPVPILAARRETDMTRPRWSQGWPTVRIGTASLVREGNRVYADLVITYDTPERFDLENGKELYAAPLVKFSQEVEIWPGSNRWVPTVLEIGNVQIIDEKLFDGMEPIGAPL